MAAILQMEGANSASFYKDKYQLEYSLNALCFDYDKTTMLIVLCAGEQ